MTPPTAIALLVPFCKLFVPASVICISLKLPFPFARRVAGTILKQMKVNRNFYGLKMYVT